MAKRQKRKKQKAFGRVFLPAFLILVIVFTLGLFAVDKYGLFGLFGGDIMKDIPTIAGGDSEFAKKYKDSKRVNVLLLGHNQELTDTIMLGSFDTELKRVDVISVPRDTYYERPDYPGAAYQKINSVYKTEGVEAMAAAVSEVLNGTPIHFYEIISDEGVAHIVDAMGGVTIDVPMDMHYTDESQNLYIDLKQGTQTLDGERAVQFLRFRKGYPTGDIGRVEAQQNFLKEAFKQSIGFGFPKVARTAVKEVETNMQLKMALRLAGKAVGMTTEDIATHTAPGEASTFNGASYYLVDAGRTAVLMDSIYGMAPTEE
ncbi:MAG: LCP family protein [Clostridiales Family XIII bacterium]|jgi:LCP family protein required for cell wall assembly|nr:LCP family protein [Clostridiales Family XIII bacterium]